MAEEMRLLNGVFIESKIWVNCVSNERTNNRVNKRWERTMGKLIRKHGRMFRIFESPPKIMDLIVYSAINLARLVLIACTQQALSFARVNRVALMGVVSNIWARDMRVANVFFYSSSQRIDFWPFQLWHARIYLGFLMTHKMERIGFGSECADAPISSSFQSAN